MPAQKTVLNDLHRAAGATMVDFHGWEMPVRYGSIPEEHSQVRSSAGLFDLCHMGRLRFTGNDAETWLQAVLTQDVSKIKIGRARYSLVCADDGKIIDDTLIYRLDASSWLLVVNASNREPVLRWIEAHRPPEAADAILEDLTPVWAMIAIQGPEALSIVQETPDLETGALADLKYYGITGSRFQDGACWIARTGYTGEDGFEVYLATDDAPALWTGLETAGGDRVRPIGLGARDTLRLEAGMPLYGHELDSTTDPYEACLGFAVKLDKAQDFGGKTRLAELQGQESRRLRGFRMDGRRIVRQGMSIFEGEREVGQITSGAPSPTLGYPIAMGYLARDVDERIEASLEVDLRGRRLPLLRHDLPFYSRK